MDVSTATAVVLGVHYLVQKCVDLNKDDSFKKKKEEADISEWSKRKLDETLSYTEKCHYLCCKLGIHRANKNIIRPC